MKVNELTNLWVGYNATEDFRVLICALDNIEAQDTANEYCNDTQMNGSFEVTEFTDMETHFDCDYILTYSGL